MTTPTARTMSCSPATSTTSTRLPSQPGQSISSDASSSISQRQELGKRKMLPHQLRRIIENRSNRTHHHRHNKYNTKSSTSAARLSFIDNNDSASTNSFLGNNGWYEEENLQVRSSPLLPVNHNNTNNEKNIRNKQERRNSGEMMIEFQSGNDIKSFQNDTEGNYNNHDYSTTLSMGDMIGASSSVDSPTSLQVRRNSLQQRSETNDAKAPRTSASQYTLRRDKSIVIDRIDIRFAALDIPYGRQLEVQQLHTALKQIQNRTLPLSVILLSGYTGTGKSTIVAKFQQNLKQEKLKRDHQKYIIKGNKSKSINGSSTQDQSQQSTNKQESAEEQKVHNNCSSSYFFVCGKFDLQRQNDQKEEATMHHQHHHQQNKQPYTAIASAFTELCSDIQALN